MVFAWRTALLRLTALVALCVSAVLTSDALHPERAFCPLAEACEIARTSALGTILGVPTSVLGMLAFGGLFLLTLLPVEWARPLLRPAGLVAALAGVGFVLYQALVLHSFCPLCLVADGAGFFAGLVTLTWPRPPVRRSGRRLEGEGASSRLAWTLAALLAAGLPFIWPRPEAPAWIEITPVSDLDLLDAEGRAQGTTARDVWAGESGAIVPGAVVPLVVPWEHGEPSRATRPPSPAPTATRADPPRPPPQGSEGLAAAPPRTAPAALDAEPPAPPTTRRPAEALHELPQGPEASGTPAPPPPVVEVAQAPAPPPPPSGEVSASIEAVPMPAPPQGSRPPQPSVEDPESPSHAPRSAAPRASVPAPSSSAEPPGKQPLLIVEYLNAYCAHCRATHARLDRIVASLDVPVRRRRVYTWAAQGYPAWARAVAFAETVGREEEMWQELLRSRTESVPEIEAAARRAGLDIASLRRALAEPTPPPRLQRDARIMRSAGLRGLPTLDIGRRRLMGEQTEAELRAALAAAQRLP